jgi:hypothetical protein
MRVAAGISVDRRYAAESNYSHLHHRRDRRRTSWRNYKSALEVIESDSDLQLVSTMPR